MQRDDPSDDVPVLCAPGRLPGLAALLVLAASPVAAQVGSGAPVHPHIPRTWDPARLEGLELPNAATGKPAELIDAEQYYALPERVVYRTYPVYARGREPDGYLAMLARKEPEVAFDPSRLETPGDWVAAGELVFRWPIRIYEYDPDSTFFLAQSLSRFGGRVTPEGIDPFTVFTIREKGKVEIGTMSCATCHTRVMDDGSVIIGAQGNSPIDAAFARSARELPERVLRPVMRDLYEMPAIDGVPPALPDMPFSDLFDLIGAIPVGVVGREGTSPLAPVQVPDLIGVRDRAYLDHTGLVRHRDIGDLMRYAALNQGIALMSRWNEFQPRSYEPAEPDGPVRPHQERYSDEQLYALASYLYSLEPPDNPNPFDAAAQRGQRVFERENCTRCHTPPSYTSNELVAAPGFEIPDELRETDAISARRVRTDATLTTITRRGTGFYKVPSLRGVWYRGPFHHDGSIATLEDWFDPARLRDDYVPTGWNPGGGARAVRGHRFGMRLTADDRAALIAFLRTL